MIIFKSFHDGILRAMGRMMKTGNVDSITSLALKALAFMVAKGEAPAGDAYFAYRA